MFKFAHYREIQIYLLIEQKLFGVKSWYNLWVSEDHIRLLGSLTISIDVCA